jgi:hypothetical protein
MDASHAEMVRTLHPEARALVPARRRVIEERESACVEFRSYPSCVIVSFDLPGTKDAREQAMQGRLRTRGWKASPSAPSFVHERGGLSANVRVPPRGRLSVLVRVR